MVGSCWKASIMSMFKNCPWSSTFDVLVNYRVWLLSLLWLFFLFVPLVSGMEFWLRHTDVGYTADQDRVQGALGLLVSW